MRAAPAAQEGTYSCVTPHALPVHLSQLVTLFEGSTQALHSGLCRPDADCDLSSPCRGAPGSQSVPNRLPDAGQSTQSTPHPSGTPSREGSAPRVACTNLPFTGVHKAHPQQPLHNSPSSSSAHS